MVDVARPLAVAATHVTKRFGQGDAAVTALDDISVECERGSFTAIMGPSGSGKSTLMHLLSGLDTADSGEITIGETRLSGLSDRGLTELRRKHVGFIFQAYNLVPTLTAEQNIALPSLLAGQAIDSAAIRSLAATLGLEGRLRHLPAQLSGGQQQRVAIARALFSQPDVIFADEPTGNLDLQRGLEVLSILQRGARELGQTIIMVTHDAHAASYADRVIVLADGKIRDTMAGGDALSIAQTLARIAA
ncbi:MAG TPA: ABC transporter ATP-binding protein [Microbacteriaceae bacterium]|nr:ABC transporter ATP-binding protein [Microbacteriaceae bacterium]